MTPVLPTLPTLLALLALSQVTLAKFYFQWSDSTSQCDVVQLSWAYVTPPLTAWVIPIYGQPFIYEIPDSATNDGEGSYEVLLQVQTDYKYVVMMSDRSGLGSGGTSEIQTVKASSDSSCLSTASQNSTSLDFTFTVSGQAVQCERGFEMSWTGGREYGPYNFTLIPLDQGFDPFDVTLESDVSYQSDWVMNLASGTRFTIVMNSKNGYGRGGVAGIYSVNGGNASECDAHPSQATGTWPATITTDTLDAATLPITQSATHTSTSSSALSGGAIAGIAVGAAAGALLVLGVLLCLLRRKRRRQRSAQAIKDHDVDLADHAYLSGEPRAGGRGRAGSQYRVVGSFAPPTEHTSLDSTDAYYVPLRSSAVSSRHVIGHDSAGESAGAGGGGSFRASGEQGGQAAVQLVPGYTSAVMDEDERESGPGVAGPLPSKSPPQLPPLPVTSPLSHASRVGSGGGGNVQSPTMANIIGGTGAADSAPTSILEQHSKRSHHRPPSPSPFEGDQHTSLASRSPSRPPHSSNRTSPGPAGAAGAAGTGTGTGGNHEGGMRVVNHDDPENLPTLLPHHPHQQAGRRRAHDGQPTFRRHADAGRVEAEVVDLPPLYSEVPRDGPRHSAESEGRV